MLVKRSGSCSCPAFLPLSPYEQLTDRGAGSQDLVLSPNGGIQDEQMGWFLLLLLRRVALSLFLESDLEEGQAAHKLVLNAGSICVYFLYPAAFRNGLNGN